MPSSMACSSSRTFGGEGIGAALVDVAVHEARRQGLTMMVVANPSARGFYEKCGFTLEGEAETRFGPALGCRASSLSYFQCRRLPSLSHSTAVGDALGPGLVLLGLGDPVEIVAPRRRREAVERGLGLGIGVERLGEVGVELGRRLGLMLDLARCRRGRGQLRRFADQRVELGIGRQVVDRRSACRTGPSRRPWHRRRGAPARARN